MELNKGLKSTESEMLFSDDEQKIEMRINEGAMAHIIARLTDLYEKPVEATVREVVSNAIDTTRRLSKADRKPIKVNLPTSLNKEFQVIDFGEGMSKETIENIYSQYGASTKGADMTQIGAYGLGAKAPLSYCSQFTVTSVKDGMKTELVISSEMGGNYTRIVSHTPTEEPNGTKVVVPVRDNDLWEFKEAAETYANYSFGVDITFLGAEYPDNKPTYVGKIEVDKLSDGTPILVDIYSSNKKKESKGTSLGDLLHFQKPTLSFALSGWLYEGESRWRKPDYIVDLIPGLVDFSSSRDNITSNHRKEKLIETINEKLFDTLKEKVEKDIQDGTLSSFTIAQEWSNFNPWGSSMGNKIDFFRENLLFKDGSRVEEVVTKDNSLFSATLSRTYSPYSAATSHTIYSFDKSNNTMITRLIEGLDKEAFSDSAIYRTKGANRIIIVSGIADLDEVKKALRKTSKLKINDGTNFFFFSLKSSDEIKKELNYVDFNFVELITIEEYNELTKQVTKKTNKPKDNKVTLSLQKTEIKTPDNLRSRIHVDSWSNPFGWEAADLKRLCAENKPDFLNVAIISDSTRDVYYSFISKVRIQLANIQLKSNKGLKIFFISRTSLSSKNIDCLENFDNIIYDEDITLRSVSLTEKFNEIVKKKDPKVSSDTVTIPFSKAVWVHSQLTREESDIVRNFAKLTPNLDEIFEGNCGFDYSVLGEVETEESDEIEVLTNRVNALKSIIEEEKDLFGIISTYRIPDFKDATGLLKVLIDKVTEVISAK